jgi:hypothetical protein
VVQTAGMGVSRRDVVIVCVALLVAACSNDSDKPAASSSSRGPASVASVSSVSAPPASSSTAASATPPGPCDAPAPPAGATAVSQAPGDFDGDGQADILVTYATNSTPPVDHHLQIQTASGHHIDTVITDALSNDASQQPHALGGADITTSAGLPPDGSGEEAFVSVGSGASVTLVAVFQLLDCTLTRLADPDTAEPATFAIGGSVTHLDGLRCDGAAGGVRLVQLSAESSDGETYATTERRLEVQNGQFVVTNAVNDTITNDDPRLQAFSVIDCPGVSNP